jgi:hypothetical protein
MMPQTSAIPRIHKRIRIQEDQDYDPGQSREVTGQFPFAIYPGFKVSFVIETLRRSLAL